MEIALERSRERRSYFFAARPPIDALISKANRPAYKHCYSCATDGVHRSGRQLKVQQDKVREIVSSLSQQTTREELLTKNFEPGR